MKDILKEKIVKVISKAEEPLETKEIVSRTNGTRITLLYRLHNLRGEGKIRGKHIGSGKGTWIWWKD